MSNVLKYETATGNAKQYIFSVNTPDYGVPQPPYSFMIDPDISSVVSVPVKYWKVSGGLVVEMNAGEKQAVDDANDAARPPILYPVYSYGTLNIYQCDNADWAINHAVPILNDPLNQSLKLMQLDNGIASGVGFNILFPEGASCVMIDVHGRASSAPATADKTLIMQARFRIIPDNAIINSWGQKALDAVTLTQDIFYHKYSWIKNVSANNVSGKAIQVQMVRRGDTDTYPAPWYLNRITFKFS